MRFFRRTAKHCDAAVPNSNATGINKLPAELVIPILSLLHPIDLFAVKLAGSRYILQIVRSRFTSLSFSVYCHLIEEETRQRWPHGPQSLLALAASRGQMSLLVALLKQPLYTLPKQTKVPDLAKLKTRSAVKSATNKPQRAALLSAIQQRTGGGAILRDALQWAAECGQDEVVQYLLNLGADPRRYVWEGTRFPSPDESHGTAIHLAAANGHASTVRLFLRDGVSPRSRKYHAFTIAAQNGHNEVIRVFLENGIDLQNAYFQPQPALAAAARAGHAATVRFLVAENAPLDEVDPDGNTALHYACSMGDEEVARFLVEQGADVRAVHREDRTSIDLALINGHAMTAKVLLGLCERPHDSTLSIAAARGHGCCVRLALELGSSRDGAWRLYRKRDYGAKADSWKMNKQNGNQQALGNGLFPAIHEAVANFHPLIVETLLEAGESADKTTWNGLTLLHFAALRYPKHQTVSMARHLVVSAGATVDPRDNNGWTPLHFAALNGDHNLIEFLVSQGADTEALALSGQTALHFANASQSRPAADMLAKLGANVRARDRFGKLPSYYAVCAKSSKAFSRLNLHSANLATLWDQRPPALQESLQSHPNQWSLPSKHVAARHEPKFLPGGAYPFPHIVNLRGYLE